MPLPTPGAPAPTVLAGLAPGDHTFSVRATDRAGNVGKPASVAWRYVAARHDGADRDARVDPAGLDHRHERELHLHCERARRRVTSARSTAPPTPRARAPPSYQSLGVGTHSFAVRGRDPAGNVGQPATFGWSIVAPPPPPPPPLPDLYVASLTKTTIIVRNGGNAAAGASSILRITVGSALAGTFTVAALAPGATATFSFACRIGTYLATVDQTNVVAESNETNNTASLTNRTCP